MDAKIRRAVHDMLYHTEYESILLGSNQSKKKNTKAWLGYQLNQPNETSVQLHDNDVTQQMITVKTAIITIISFKYNVIIVSCPPLVIEKPEESVC